jgi:hypothetical protein
VEVFIRSFDYVIFELKKNGNLNVEAIFKRYYANFLENDMLSKLVETVGSEM